MIIEGILALVLGIVQVILTPVNIVIGAIPSQYITTFIEIIYKVNYFLPLNLLLPIVAIILALQVFRIAIAIIKTIWEVLPIV